MCGRTCSKHFKRVCLSLTSDYAQPVYPSNTSCSFCNNANGNKQTPHLGFLSNYGTDLFTDTVKCTDLFTDTVKCTDLFTDTVKCTDLFTDTVTTK